MTGIGNKLKEKVENTIFFAKNTAQVGNYLKGTKTSQVIAYSGAVLKYAQNRCVIINPNSCKSSKSILSSPTKLSDFVTRSSIHKYYWMYEPYEWGDNLEYSAIKVLANSFFLFRRYSNKLNQIRFFAKFGDEIISQHLRKL